MEAELSEFMNENPTPKPDDDDERQRASRLAMFAERRKAEEAKRAEADKSIFDDVASQLDQ